MNKKMTSAYRRYAQSSMHDLHDAYRSFSEAKYDAWKYCKELCKEKNGTGLKIIGANTNFFSAGFEYEEGGKRKFMYITHGGDYSAEV